ncbi:efflux RND transporter permease subunit [Orrella sp. JC864]|uniref:efflux RND transporter permease subunit n=1 Tax=Orrella sp. JC864 TaxID=3120298 RepID=UPI00300BF389
MNLSRPFVRRPVASLLLALAIMLLGALSWRLLPVSPLPEVDFPAIIVRANLPGADPETMASTVAAPLERAMGSIAGITQLVSSSSTGSTMLLLTFDLDRDINDAARDVQAAINAAQGTLPSGMPSAPSYDKINPSQAPILALALSSRDLSPGQLYDAASTILAQKLAQVAGVGDVTVDGASLPAVRVQLNPNALAHYGIALDEVRNAITAANPLRPRGDLMGPELHWQIQTSEQMRRADQYRDLIIRHQDGAAVRLGDVAIVSDSVENRYSSGFHNQRQAVTILVSRQPGANIVQTIDAINAQLPTLGALAPAAAELTVVMDRSPVIRATLREAQLTLLIASGLVVLVVLGFLGSLRAALIPSLAIPVSLIGTFAIMYLYGFSLNNLSLMALIVAAGLVVDDAIVVMENIQRHIEKGMPPMRAAMRGAGEVGFTLLAMNLALIVVFVSILFMGGLVERLFREFSITLAAAMLVSLLVSLTLTPSLCARLLPARGARQPGRLQRISEDLFRKLLRGYSSTLRASLRHTPWVLAALLAVLALNVHLYIAIPKGFMPDQDTGQLRGFVRGDDGASYQSMQPKLEAFRQVLLADPAVQDVIGTSGGDRGISNATLYVRLKPRSERSESANEVINRIRAAQPPLPAGRLFLSVDQDLNPPRMQGSAGSYELTLLSSDLGLLRQWERRVAEALQNVPEITDVDGGPGEGTQQLTLRIDRQAAKQLGVDMDTVTQVLNNSFSQRQVATLYSALNQYRVVMEVEPQYTQSPRVLDQLLIQTADGAQVPLSAIASYSYSQAADRVRHTRQFASTSVSYSLAPGVSLDQALAAVDRALEQLMLPTDIQVESGGMASTFQAASQDQPLLLLMVLVAVYLVLGMLYESLLHPVTILSTLPSAGVGALLTLRATDTQFTLIALLGLFLLIGIVMKNAIMMIDFALEAQRKRGLSPAQAIYHAARLRLRPILMTNLAGLLGAVPLVLSVGDGAEMRQPLGLAIVGGLAVSQLLTLYTTPAMYLFLDRLRQRRQARRAARTAAQPQGSAP